jgi:hypothetical protein
MILIFVVPSRLYTRRNDPFAFVGDILQKSTGQLRTKQFGWVFAQPSPGEYNGDGKTNFAVLDP